jgi:positive regulator of sigma E activity
MYIVALVLFLLAVWLLPAIVMLIATVAILLLAVASIWARHRMHRRLEASAIVDQALVGIAGGRRREDSTAVITGPDHPLWAKGGRCG